MKSRLSIAAISVMCAFFLLSATLLAGCSQTSGQKYNIAIGLMEEEKYTEAIAKFQELGDYRDCLEKIAQCQTLQQQMEIYRTAADYIAQEQYGKAAIALYGAGTYKDSAALASNLWGLVAVRNPLSTGAFHTVARMEDGTVVATGANTHLQCEVSGWQNIIAVSAGPFFTVGLKADGTVVATGENSSGQCNVESFTDIVAIATGTEFTAGLKADGTIIIAGRYNQSSENENDVTKWKDVTAIYAIGLDLVALKTDGAFSGTSPDLDFTGWENIISIAAGADHIVGLKADGTVVATGSNSYSQCQVADWENIVTIGAGDGYTVGIKADGSTCFAGREWVGQAQASGWQHMSGICGGGDFMVGIKPDGTIVAVGANSYGQCNVQKWPSADKFMTEMEQEKLDAANEKAYQEALDLMNSGKYQEAIDKFESIGGYKDSGNMGSQCQTLISEDAYQKALALKNEGKTAQAAIAFGKLGDYKDSAALCTALWDKVAVRETLVGGGTWVFGSGDPNYVGLKTDGTVVAIGDNAGKQCEVASWRNIIAVCTDGGSTLGLTADGRVLYTGIFDHPTYDYYNDFDPSGWRDIVAICLGSNSAYGLRKDGTVVACGVKIDHKEEVESWTDIVSLHSTNDLVFGIRVDGTVVISGYSYVLDNDYYAYYLEAATWTDIVELHGSSNTLVGLKSDGTVVAVGYNGYGNCAVESWTDIVAIKNLGSHTVGLKADGTVVIAGEKWKSENMSKEQYDKLKDIVSITDIGPIVCRKADGSIVVAGWWRNSLIDEVAQWKDIALPNR